MSWKDFVDDLGLKEGVLIGAVGAGALVIALGLSSGWLNAQFWHVMTAFGTVGAVWFSAWQAVRLRTMKTDEEKHLLSAVAITIDEALASLRWTFDHLTVVHAGTAPLNESEVEGFLFSAGVVTTIPFHEHPYCRCYKDILQTVLKVKTAAHIVTKCLKGGIDQNDLDSLESNWKLACAEFNAALTKPAFRGVTRPVTGYISPIRFKC